MRAHNFEEANYAIKKMPYNWDSARGFGEKYQFPPEELKKLLELDDMMMALVIIAKYHQPEPTEASGKAPVQAEKLTTPEKWDTPLPSRYTELDWNDFRKSVIFADNYLLNEDMHYLSEDSEAMTDRVKAAHRHTNEIAQ